MTDLSLRLQEIQERADYVRTHVSVFTDTTREEFIELVTEGDADRAVLLGELSRLTQEGEAQREDITALRGEVSIIQVAGCELVDKLKAAEQEKSANLRYAAIVIDENHAFRARVSVLEAALRDSIKALEEVEAEGCDWLPAHIMKSIGERRVLLSPGTET